MGKDESEIDVSTIPNADLLKKILASNVETNRQLKKLVVIHYESEETNRLLKNLIKLLGDLPVRD